MIYTSKKYTIDMKKFTESLETTNSTWSWTGKIEVDGFTDGRTREDAMGTIENYLKQRLGDKVKISSIETNHQPEEVAKMDESYSYGLIKNYNISIGVYSYTSGGNNYWSMLDGGTSAPIVLVVDKNEPLDFKRPYLFKWIGDGPYASPVDLEQIQWVL